MEITQEQPVEISPEQQIVNMLRALKREVNQPRQRQQTNEIRAMVRDLELMLDLHFQGLLAPALVDDDHPF